ncbi:hypothetical protein QBC40DRAFT_280755 [Triangularia verruculosa]|uniref:2EXR domain-containing protein n=1 Tax=Triangularia verruculosa TaxID=2587418 RepID=A0AAN6XG92_9PEZI|nr:hypothetical protein QBC40DRAFT_280755 [Triangularia verruculosa]
MGNRDPKVNNDRQELTEFTFFPRLPASVRQQIWSIAASFASRPTPSRPGICIFDPSDPVFTDRHHCTTRPPKLVVHEPYNRALLSVNTEAHDIALMSSGSCARDYDPEVDILYIPSHALYLFVKRECSHRRKYMSKTRHLAFPVIIQSLPTHAPSIFHKVPSLETITVVFPNYEGTTATVQCIEEDKSPLAEQQLMRMKRLTAEELKGIETKMEFGYEDSIGMYYLATAPTSPVMRAGGNVYRKEPSTGWKHFQAFQRTVNEACSPDRTREWRPLSPLWDHERDGLGVKWQASTFKAWPKRTRFVDCVMTLAEDGSAQAKIHSSIGRQTGQ